MRYSLVGDDSDCVKCSLCDCDFTAVFEQVSLLNNENFVVVFYFQSLQKMASKAAPTVKAAFTTSCTNPFFFFPSRFSLNANTF